MTAIAPDYFSEQATKIYYNEPGGTKLHSPLAPDEFYGRVRIFRGYYKNTTGSTIAANKVISLTKLPAGRILPNSVVYFTALGASRTLDIGYNDHKKNDGTAVANDIDALVDGVDASSAGSTTVGVLAANIQGLKLEGQAEILCKILGDTMPANGEISALFFVAID